MNKHRENLKKVCRYCGQKAERLRPLSTFAQGKRIYHRNLLNEIFQNDSIYPVPEEKFCTTCGANIIKLSTEFHHSEKEAVQEFANELKKNCVKFLKHLDDCNVCSQFETEDMVTEDREVVDRGKEDEENNGKKMTSSLH